MLWRRSNLPWVQRADAEDSSQEKLNIYSGLMGCAHILGLHIINYGQENAVPPGFYFINCNLKVIPLQFSKSTGTCWKSCLGLGPRERGCGGWPWRSLDSSHCFHQHKLLHKKSISESKPHSASTHYKTGLLFTWKLRYISKSIGKRAWYDLTYFMPVNDRTNFKFLIQF